MTSANRNECKAKMVIGVKQVTKAVNKGLASEVILANDVAEGLLDNLKQLCQEKEISWRQDVAKSELGKECGIACDASAAAILK